MQECQLASLPQMVDNTIWVHQALRLREQDSRLGVADTHNKASGTLAYRPRELFLRITSLASLEIRVYALIQSWEPVNIGRNTR